MKLPFPLLQLQQLVILYLSLPFWGMEVELGLGVVLLTGKHFLAPGKLQSPDFLFALCPVLIVFCSWLGFGFYLFI